MILMIRAIGKRTIKKTRPKIILLFIHPRTCPKAIHPLYGIESKLGFKIAKNRKVNPSHTVQNLKLWPLNEGKTNPMKNGKKNPIKIPNSRNFFLEKE